MRKTAGFCINNVNIATMSASSNFANVPYGIKENGSVYINAGRIEKIDDANHLSADRINVIDGQGQWLLPGLIDCHTHLVYAGNRASEFEMRQQGKSYSEIAKQGGGIQSTVNATRQASYESLLHLAKNRAARLIEEGVTTIEVKSGYGLDLETELRMLHVAKDLERTLSVNIEPTYLGAHSVPKEYRESPDEYVKFVCEQVLPEVVKQGLATSVDVFCETIGFTPAQCETVFIAAKDHGLNVKAHVEQLSDLKGAKLAAKYHALSVDHIEYLQPEDIPALAKSNTVAVVLPGAFYSLRETQLPPIAALRAHNVPMAIATDLNPGSSPIASLLTIMNMGCVLFGMTPEEALLGVTRHAAQALGLNRKGQIVTGFDADLGLWNIQHPCELSYGINQVRPSRIWVNGEER
ncbi:imidazolonepropionase [Paraglaciecola agarilytica]|uniref:imidazolonepropionase n=1 Tax=Paraglaciecola chathamensis TaxID=368405 RepID=UPI001C08FD20|nr:imidazolonepropionase [Paraglaciecola agarilytica]MBU3019260.1 imidazolonepropionase [Paraglaciecola agarilytica]